MRILTLIRQVLDAEESVRVRYGAVDLEGSKLVMDTMDEYGVEQALRLRESGAEAEVVAVRSAGAQQEAVRTALAMGADRGIHVVTDVALDAIALSAVMAQIARQEGAELIFCGGQEADWDSQALGAATAERLRWPQATWTSALELKGRRWSGSTRRTRAASRLRCALPAVVTTQQGLNEPRYPTLPNIISRRRKRFARRRWSISAPE